MILELRAALEYPTCPVKPSGSPSPRGMLGRDSGLPNHTRNLMGTSGNVFEDPLAPAGSSPSFFNLPRNIISSLCELRSGNTESTMRHGERLRREPQSSTIPSPRFTRTCETWNPLCHTGETYSQNCMMEHRGTLSRNCMSENSQTQVTFNVRQSTSRQKSV